MRAATLLLFLVAGCSEEILVDRTAPWAKDAQLALMILDENSMPESPPRLFRAGGKLELQLLPGSAKELVIYEYAADARAPDGTPLVDCGAVYAQSRSPINGLIRQYRSGLIDTDDPERFELVASTEPLIPIFHERCTIGVCMGIDVDSVVMPFSGTEMRVAAGIGKDDAYVVGEIANTGASPQMAITKVVNRLPTPIVASPLLVGRASRLVFDGARTFYGAAAPDDREGGNLFAFDLDGQPSVVPNLALGVTRKRIAVGADGSLFAGGDAGLFEITRGSTVAKRIDAFEREVHGLAVARRDRMVVLDRRPAINFYDGVEWVTEWTGMPTIGIEDAAIDDEQAIVVGSFGTVLRRNESTREWEAIPLPDGDNASAINSVALLAGHRFAVAFDLGGVGIWNGSDWCLEAAPTTSGKVLNLAPSPSGRWAFGVTRAEPVTGSELRIIEVPRL